MEIGQREKKVLLFPAPHNLSSFVFLSGWCKYIKSSDLWPEMFLVVLAVSLFLRGEVSYLLGCSFFFPDSLSYTARLVTCHHPLFKATWAGAALAPHPAWHGSEACHALYDIVSLLLMSTVATSCLGYLALPFFVPKSLRPFEKQLDQ